MKHCAVPALALAAGAALYAGSALANGRFPAAQFAVVGPGANSDQILVRNTFGVVYSDDGGQSFNYLCEVALGIANPDAQADPSVWIGADGALLVGTENGMLRFVNRCTPESPDALNITVVRDIASDPSGQHVYAALEVTDTSLGGRVASSDDGGRTYTLRGSTLPGLRFHTLDVAAGNTQRLYATLAPASGSGGQGLEFRRSDDGGNTWSITMPLAGFDDAFVAAVDPTNPDVVYVRAIPTMTTSVGDAAATRPTVLLRSTDGGQSFGAPVGNTNGPMEGFAISDDGRTVWIGGSADGLLRSDNGGAFVQVNTAAVSCLRYHAGALYVCEPFSASPTLLGKSTDQGATITDVLRYADIGPPPSCLPASQLNVCNSEWAVRIQRFGGSPDAGRRDAGLDASPDGGGQNPRGGCHCRAGSSGAGDSSERSTVAMGLTAAVLLTWSLRRSRRLSPSRRA